MPPRPTPDRINQGFGGRIRQARGLGNVYLCGMAVMTLQRPEPDFDPEEPVLDAIRQGDPYAFNEFVHRHRRWVEGVVFSVLGDRNRVDDVAQQAWTNAWQRIGELRDLKRWRPWLYRIARNAALDAGREATRHKHRTQALAAAPPEPPARETPEEQLARTEKGAAMLAAIAGLPPLYREPFVLRHLNGWSYRQIADVLDMPVDSVETRLVRARRLLREALGNLPTA